MGWLILAIAGAFFRPAAAGQVLPPPGDGDVRAVYWDLRSQSEVWLTLEPKGPKGERAPMLTLTYRFAGKWPAGPPTEIDLRAYAGFLWAPRPELWLVIDNKKKLDLGSPRGLISSAPSDYLSQMISIEVVRELATARRIEGNALGFPFELSDSQRRAIGMFLDRIASENPTGLPKRESWASLPLLRSAAARR